MKQKMKLQIRKMKQEDLGSLYTLLSNEEVMRFLEPPFSEEQTKEFLETQGLTNEPRVFAVADKDDLFIGYVIYHPYDERSMEIGWVLSPKIWKQGIASHLTEKLIEKATAEGKDIVIECVPEQFATKQIADKYGFTYLGKSEGLDIYRRFLRQQVRIVDEDIKLIPYYPNSDETLEWYQDPELCKQVDNVDEVYTLEKLNRMYAFLAENGHCYYISYHGKLVGDITLRDNAEICLVVCKEYQNRHIGRRCVQNMIELAKEQGLTELKAQIYVFNKQSQKMFEAVGFRKISEEEWRISLL